MISAAGWVGPVTQVAMSVMALAMVLAVVRLLKGPSLCDRVIAMDLLMNLAVGVIALYTVGSGKTVFLYAVIVTSLISFLGTVGFVYYIERRNT
ncbi:MAG: Na(+)/H(+) antiporter subunit F [Candidatus Omnitrophica bacterium]|nr:Na(+)/H(+) antiporter subunit F [Candidatus Omnitrophota bacterium]